MYVPDSFVFHLFLSTPSVKRATLELLRGLLRFKLFLSTPSARRATAAAPVLRAAAAHFYPRPPRGGRQWLRFWAAA